MLVFGTDGEWPPTGVRRHPTALGLRSPVIFDVNSVNSVDTAEDSADAFSSSGIRTALFTGEIQHVGSTVVQRHRLTHTADARHVAPVVRPVAQAVNGEIEASVQVRQHRGVDMDRQRQTVRVVAQQHDDIRAPAADERYEDDEHRLHLTNRLYRCYVPGFVGYLKKNIRRQNCFDDNKQSASVVAGEQEAIATTREIVPFQNFSLSKILFLVEICLQPSVMKF